MEDEVEKLKGIASCYVDKEEIAHYLGACFTEQFDWKEQYNNRDKEIETLKEDQKMFQSYCEVLDGYPDQWEDMIKEAGFIRNDHGEIVAMGWTDKEELIHDQNHPFS